MTRSNDAVQRAAGRPQLIDAARDFRVFYKRGRVVGLDRGVDDERTGAAPVFLVRESADAVDVRRRV